LPRSDNLRGVSEFAAAALFLHPWPRDPPLSKPSVIGSILTRTRAPNHLSLAQRCVVGDRSAQREVFDREVRRGDPALYRILGSNAFIDDLKQAAFLEVFRSLKNFRGEASPATWVARLVVHLNLGDPTHPDSFVAE